VSETAPGTPALEVRSVTKRFGGQVALDGVSLAIAKGSVHAIAGENGAGKSTLIKLLAGVHEPDEGEILVGGEPTRIANPRVAQSLRLGFLHQRLNLVSSLSVRENVLLTSSYPTALGRIEWAEVDRRCAKALDTAGIEVHPRRPLRELNPAQQQLVALARVLSERPEVLVLDEPTATLGASDTEHLLGVIRAQRQRGATVIFVSHRLDEILELADTVTVLRDGRLVASEPRDGLTRARLVQLLGGATQEAERLERTDQDEEHAAGRRRGAPLLEVRGLESPGLDNPVDLALHAGEVVGLAGLVGSGRSTLATILAGGGTVSAGSILVDGSEVTLRNRRDAIAHGIVLVPPDRSEGIVPDFDVAANLTLGNVKRYTRWGFMIDGRAERRAAQGYVDQLNIRLAKGGSAARNLSGGNQQKVLIARALDRSPRVLVLDEPTAGVDVGTKEHVYALVRSLAEDGLAILFISSELEEIALVADRTLVFSRGRVSSELPGSATRSEIVHRLFEAAPVAGAAA
jgi:ABC-type sugar transport system ATPase subunit